MRRDPGRIRERRVSNQHEMELRLDGQVPARELSPSQKQIADAIVDRNGKQHALVLCCPANRHTIQPAISLAVLLALPWRQPCSICSCAT
jgi:hypothetical protein